MAANPSPTAAPPAVAAGTRYRVDTFSGTTCATALGDRPIIVTPGVCTPVPRANNAAPISSVSLVGSGAGYATPPFVVGFFPASVTCSGFAMGFSSAPAAGTCTADAGLNPSISIRISVSGVSAATAGLLSLLLAVAAVAFSVLA
jgi:hypothetical protein